MSARAWYSRSYVITPQRDVADGTCAFSRASRKTSAYARVIGSLF